MVELVPASSAVRVEGRYICRPMPVHGFSACATGSAIPAELARVREAVTLAGDPGVRYDTLS